MRVPATANQLPRVQPGQNADPTSPTRMPAAERPDPLARVEPEREQDDEDRHGGVGDRCHRVDVLLPQAMRTNGSAALRKPTAKALHPVSRTSATARLAPTCHASTGISTALASTRRKNIIAVGSTSSTATLMNRYEAPQIAATIASSGT